MDIVFHAHHAVMSARLQARATRSLDKLSERLAGAVDAVVRFEQDGPVRRVEIVVNAPRGRRLVSEATARNYGPALTAALKHLEVQLSREKRDAKDKARKAARA